MDFAKGEALKRFLLLLALLLTLPLPAAETDEEILALLRATLKGKGDYIQRKVERIGEKTIRIESYISMEGDLKWFGKIATDVSDYGTWLLNKINEKPDGGTYPVKIMGLDKDPEDAINGLFAQMRLDFPVIKKDLRRKLRFIPHVSKSRVLIDGEMPDAKDNMMSAGSAKLVFFQADGEPSRMWGYVEGKIKIRNWLLYEALPTGILKREAGERFQQVITNYLAEENRRIRLSQSPKGKTATLGD